MSAMPPIVEQPTVLEAVGVSKRFALRRRALDVLKGYAPPMLRAVETVSLKVARGETLGIVGESGCGKSTLARCLVRLLEPDAGDIRFKGESVLHLGGLAKREYNRRVQMVFQDPYGSLNPRLSVGDALAEALAVHRVVEGSAIATRVGELLDLVHLPQDAARRYPHEFSGGQRQRIAIARALSVEPAILIADEPVSALDVSVQAQIVNLFLELQARLQLSLIFITHDLRLVRHIAHRTMVMYLGRVVETGPTQALFERPQHPYTRALIDAVPQIKPGARSQAAVVRGELPPISAPPPGCAFHPRCQIMQPRCQVDVPGLVPRALSDPVASDAPIPWPVACHEAGRPLVQLKMGPS